MSLFGEASDLILLEPKVPICEPWPMLIKLNREKEVVGFYISGHPLDDYKLEMNSFCNLNISEIKDLEAIKGRDIRIAGMVSEVEHRFTKKGNPFVQERKWKEGELDMKIVSLELLSEIKEKTIRSVLLKVNLEDLSPNLFENVSELCEEYKGKHNLKFVVSDYKDGYQVGLRSKKYKVNLEDDFLNSLKQISNIDLEIN